VVVKSLSLPFVYYFFRSGILSVPVALSGYGSPIIIILSLTEIISHLDEFDVFIDAVKKMMIETANTSDKIS
jgi:hypothetical protein